MASQHLVLHQGIQTTDDETDELEFFSSVDQAEYRAEEIAKLNPGDAVTVALVIEQAVAPVGPVKWI